ATPGVNGPDTKTVWNGGEERPRNSLAQAVGYEHRVIVGAAAARFTTYLAQALGEMGRVLLRARAPCVVRSAETLHRWPAAFQASASDEQTPPGNECGPRGDAGMAKIEVKVPDIGGYDDVPVIELLVKVGDTVAVDQGL